MAGRVPGWLSGCPGRRTGGVVAVLLFGLMACNRDLTRMAPDGAGVVEVLDADTPMVVADGAGGPAGAALDANTLFNLLAAEFAGNAGDIEAATTFYGRVIDTTVDPDVAARATYIALFGKDYERALVALARWRALQPDSDEMVRMYAVTLLKLSRPEEAAPFIQQIFDQSGASATEKVLGLKTLLAKEASAEEALQVLKILNRQHPENYRMLVLQAKYEAQLKQFDAALSHLDEVYARDDSMIEVLVIKARILIAQGRNREAAEQIRQVLEKQPDNNNLRMQYARMLLEQKQLEAAEKHYLILDEAVADNEDINLALALIYIDTRQLDKAKQRLRRLIEMERKVSIAHYYLGRLAQNDGQPGRAMEHFARVEEARYAFDARLRLAALMAADGQVDAALHNLEALAEEQSDWNLRVRVYLAQGEILRSQRRYAEGVEMYSRALQQKRDDPNLLYARGLMAEKVDRLDMAESDLRKVISLNPDNANALNALGYTLADRTSRYQEALEYIKRALALIPDDPSILDSLGWVSYRLGRMEEAEKWLSRAFEKLEDAEIAAHYGEVLWHLDKKDLARQVWQKGMKNNASHPVLVETLRRIKP